MTKLLSYLSPALFFVPQIIVAVLLLPLGLTRRLLRSAKKGSSWTRTMLFLAIAVIGASSLPGLSGCGGASNRSATCNPQHHAGGQPHSPGHGYE
jgi:hypothetical protein